MRKVTRIRKDHRYNKLYRLLTIRSPERGKRMNSISVFLSDSPAILPIIFAMLLTVVSVAGAYAYRANKKIDKKRKITVEIRSR